MISRILASLMFVFFINFLHAQSPGLVLQGGLSSMYCKDPKVTSKNQGHSGWFVGADARLLSGGMYFILGGQYHKTSLASESVAGYFSNNDWTIGTMRLGVGFDIWRLSHDVVLRSKILGSVNFTVDSPKDGLNIDGYKVVNDSFMGGTTGLGLTLGIFDFDLEYQYGFINAYYQQPNSSFDIWSLSAGLHF